MLSLGRDATLLLLLIAGPSSPWADRLPRRGVFQAVTQSGETLTFIPKLIAILGVLGLFGPFMLMPLVGFTIDLLANLDTFTR